MHEGNENYFVTKLTKRVNKKVKKLETEEEELKKLKMQVLENYE